MFVCVPRCVELTICIHADKDNEKDETATTTKMKKEMNEKLKQTTKKKGKAKKGAKIMNLWLRDCSRHYLEYYKYVCHTASGQRTVK